MGLARNFGLARFGQNECYKLILFRFEMSIISSKFGLLDSQLFFFIMIKMCIISSF